MLTDEERRELVQEANLVPANHADAVATVFHYSEGRVDQAVHAARSADQPEPPAIGLDARRRTLTAVLVPEELSPHQRVGPYTRPSKSC